MRVWMIGAGHAGTEALRQLQKHDEIEIIVSADQDRPQAVKDGVIARVDYVEVVTSVNVNAMARRIRPDLILLDTTAVGALGRVTGGNALSQALIAEIAAASDYPCLILGG